MTHVHEPAVHRRTGPIDGVVTEGGSQGDESRLAGESMSGSSAIVALNALLLKRLPLANIAGSLRMPSKESTR